MNSVDKTNLYCNITTVKNFRINALYTSRLSLGVTLAKLRNIEGVLTANDLNYLLNSLQTSLQFSRAPVQVLKMGAVVVTRGIANTLIAWKTQWNFSFFRSEKSVRNYLGLCGVKGSERRRVQSDRLVEGSLVTLPRWAVDKNERIQFSNINRWMSTM